MLWRIWVLTSGSALALLAESARRRPPGALALTSIGVGFGVGLLLLATALQRRFAHEPERGRHLAAAASGTALALPLAVALRLAAPAPVGWFLFSALAVAALLALGFARAIGAVGPAPGPAGWVARAVGAAAGGGLVVVLLASALGAQDEPPALVSLPGRWRNALLAIDAGVPLAPKLACSSRPRSVSVLTVHGAHPRFDPSGRFLWFDAPGPSGRRQIHRLRWPEGPERCWTCGEAGNNRWPAPGGPTAVVFETDRFASWWRPLDTELAIALARAGGEPLPSRRLTFHPGPDERPLWLPGSAIVAWSRAAGGAAQVVVAGLRSGHGAVSLDPPQPFTQPSFRWMAPVAWSPDARALVLLSGNPFAPAEGWLTDPAEGRLEPLEAAPSGGAAFSVDGQAFVVASQPVAGWRRLVPPGLGAVLGPVAGGSGAVALAVRPAELRWRASPAAPLRRLALDAWTRWGEAEGLTLAPDGRTLVLAQRRRTRQGTEERMLRIELSCTP